MSTTSSMKYWLPPVIYTGLIIFSSSLPGSIVVEYTFNISDKILHTVHFMFYGLTLMWAFSGSEPINTAFKKAYLKTVGIGIIVGFLDEFYQSFIPTRTASGWDVLADSVGILVAGIVFYYLVKIPALKRIRRYVKTDQN